MMLRRSHPGREVQGGAAACGWVLGGTAGAGGPGRGFVIPETRCHRGVTSPARDRDGRELLIGCRACRQASREQKREERRGMERAKEELNGKGAEEGRHKSLSRARRSVSRRMSPGPGRIDSFLQQPARKKCFTVLQDTDSSQLMFLRALN